MHALTAEEKLVRLQNDVVEVKDVQDKHGWVVGGFQVHSQGDRAVVVVSATLCARVSRTNQAWS